LHLTMQKGGMATWNVVNEVVDTSWRDFMMRPTINIILL
jgi:hypothetical protein